MSLVPLYFSIPTGRISCSNRGEPIHLAIPFSCWAYLVLVCLYNTLFWIKVDIWRLVKRSLFQIRNKQVLTSIRAPTLVCYSPLWSFCHCRLHLPLSICFLILWLWTRQGEGKNDRRETHSSVGWCIIDPVLPSGWKVEVCVCSQNGATGTWMSSAKLCVSSHNKLTGVCLLLRLFISVYIWCFQIIIFSYSSLASPRWGSFTSATSLVSICKDLFFQTSKVINEAADCCGRPFYMWTNGCSRCLDGLRAN